MNIYEHEPPREMLRMLQQAHIQNFSQDNRTLKIQNLFKY